MPVLCSQAVGLEFESLSFQIFLWFILNLFWSPKLVKHYWVPLRFFRHCETNIFWRKFVIPPIMHKYFRYPDFFEALKWCPRNFSALWDRKSSTENVIPLFSSTKLFETRIFSKTVGVPYEVFRHCETKIFHQKIVTPSCIKYENQWWNWCL